MVIGVVSKHSVDQMPFDQMSFDQETRNHRNPLGIFFHVSKLESWERTESKLLRMFTTLLTIIILNNNRIYYDNKKILK